MSVFLSSGYQAGTSPAVFFLDEFPLFRSDVIEALRQPLESGEVTIARGEESATYPARSMVVMACNPCPCGGYQGGLGQNDCGCTEVARRRYQRRVTGPVHDRIDIVRHVLPPIGSTPAGSLFPRERSAQVRERVGLARERQSARFRDRSWRLNSQVPSAALRAEWPLPERAQSRLDEDLYRGRLSRRGAVRAHRLAWTVADVRGSDSPDEADVDTALRLRSGAALVERALRRAS